ncbi:MAG: response regulator [Verrucomicrobiota bacterium]
MTLTPHIYIIDDDKSIRTSLERVLRSSGLSSKVFPSAEAFLKNADIASHKPCCIILDVRMDGIDGLELQNRLSKLQSSTPIIFLTGHGDIPMSVKAMKLGAYDFLTKPVDATLLLDTVDRALKFHARLLTETNPAIKTRLSRLTPREFEVMRCVIGGALNKQIASHLNIAEKTVKVHRGRVTQKLGIESVADLVRLSIKAKVKPIETS